MIKLLILALMFANTAFAAPDFDQIEKVRHELRSQKQAMVLDGMQLSAEQEKVFLPLYTEYNQALMLIRDQRFTMLKSYMSNYSMMDEKRADDLAQIALKLEKERTQLRETYYNKMAKQISAVTAIRFLQVDNQISTLLNVLRVRAIPLIKTPEEVATELGLGMSSAVDGDVDVMMDTITEDKMSRRIEEERAKKGL